MTGARYWAGRLLTSLGLLALLSAVVFVGVDLLPGDPATLRLGGSASPEQIAEAQHRLGLDRPLLERYADWLGGLVRGDLGTASGGAEVTGLLGDRLLDSALLVGATMALLVPLSLGLGLALGLRAGARSDRAASGLLLVLVAVPDYVVASLLVLLLAVGLGWLPAVSQVPAGESPLAHPEVLVIPVLSLLLVSLAFATRVIRAATLQAVRAPHVDFLRLNGLPARTVLADAVLPAVLPAALQVWLLGAAALLGGTVLVETVVDYPGIGDLLVTSVRAGDLPVVQGLVMVLGTATLVATMLADLLGSRVSRTASP